MMVTEKSNDEETAVDKKKTKIRCSCPLVVVVAWFVGDVMPFGFSLY
jgi:hypothetical protein